MSYFGQETLATLQLAWKERAVLFHLAKFGSFPGHLKMLFEQLLQNPTIQKIGRNVGGDVAKLIRDFSLTVEARGIIELGSFARNRGVIPDGRQSLSVIVQNTFNKTLSKDHLVRFSNWNGDLNGDQVAYALLDAYASLISYEKIVSLPDTNARLALEDCQVGTQVHYCPGGRPVLSGTVIAQTRKKVKVRVVEILMPAYNRAHTGETITVLPQTLKINAVQWQQIGIFLLN